MAGKYPLEELAKKRNMTVGDLVREALVANDWNKTDAAGDLDVTRQALYDAMKGWGIPFKDPDKVKGKRKVGLDKRSV